MLARLVTGAAAAALGSGLLTVVGPPPTADASAAATAPASSWAVSPGAGATLPERMAATGGGSQLITAVTNGRGNAARNGTLTWWRRSGGRWVKVGSAPARFGVHGLSSNRREGDGTTPAGLYPLPMAFGIKADPGTRMPWRRVGPRSWWNGNARSARYNTWHENCPRTVCWRSSTGRARSSEHLADYRRQYAYGVVIGFNTGASPVRPPRRPSGSGIFLHVSGRGYTAGCISVSRSTMVALLRWLDPAASPHIAIGNARSIYRY